jgi:hypothetical protein
MGNRKGRSRSTKPRTPSGQVSRAGARDYGNMRVVERHSRFQHFIDDKGLVHEGTSAGRLWIVGAFDGLDIDGQVLRDHLLAYGAAYWGASGYPCGAAVANYTQENRRGNAGGEYTDPDPRGEWFEALDKILTDAGRQARQAVVEVAVDPHFFPDEDKPWVARIINSRVLDKRRAMGNPPATLSICGELAVDSDWAMLELARFGAMALATGQSRKRAA